MVFPGGLFHEESACNAGDLVGASQVALVVRNPPANAGDVRDKGSRVGKIPWRPWQPTPVFLGFPGGSAGKNLPAIQETWVQTLGWEDPQEKETATHSIILAWRIPWTV